VVLIVDQQDRWVIIGKTYVILMGYGAPEERRRQSPERSVIPEEFGRPAKHLIPVNDTSLQPGGV